MQKVSTISFRVTVALRYADNDYLHLIKVILLFPMSVILVMGTWVEMTRNGAAVRLHPRAKPADKSES